MRLAHDYLGMLSFCLYWCTRTQENQEHDFGSDLHLLQLQLVREKSVKAGLKMTEDQETIKTLGSKCRRLAHVCSDEVIEPLVG